MKDVNLAKLFVYLLIWIISCVVSADPLKPEQLEVKTTEISPSFNALQADWVFSGRVTNESGEHYNYYFQMQRNHTQFHAVAMLFDSQNKAVLLFEESDATIARADEITHWQVGRAFLQFNPINDSWVFGVKTKMHKGFNFKVDMLGSTENTSSRNLRSGIELLVMQTGPLNGHLQTGSGNKEQFVMAPKSWFKQIWASKPQESLHPLTGILCQFNDGSGFYAVNLQEPDALQGAVAGWRDGQGMPMSMSQFVSVKKSKEGVWYIGIALPKVHLALQDVLTKENERYQLVAGLTEKTKPGFCTISKNDIGQHV